MARIDAIGGEPNLASEIDATVDTAVGGTRSVASSALQALSGTRSWRVERTGVTGAGQVMGQVNVAGAPQIITIKFSLYLSTAANNERPMVARFGTGSAFAQVGAVNAGAGTYELRVALEPTTGSGTGSGFLTGLLNTWEHFVLTIERDYSGAADRATLRQERGQRTLVSISGVDHLTGGVSDIRFGAGDASSANFLGYFDDIIIDNAVASDLMPHHRLLYLDPDAVGDSMTMTLVGGGTAQANLSDASDTTGVRGSGAGATVAYVNATGGMRAVATIPVVYSSIRHGDTADTGGRNQMALRLAAVSAFTGIFASSTVITTKRSGQVTTTKPGGGAWTPTDIDALQLGVFKTDAGGLILDQFTVWKAWAYAEYALNKPVTTNMVGVAAVNRRTSPLPKLATMVGVAAMARLIAAKREFTVNMVGIAARQLLISPIVKLATLVGVAAFTRRITAGRAFTVSMVGVGAVQRLISTARTASMVGVADFSRRITAGRSFTVNMVGIGALQRLTRTAREAVMVGVAAFSRRITAARAFTTSMVGVAEFARRIAGFRSFATNMVGVAAFARRLTAVRVLTVNFVGVATFTRAITAARSFTANMIGVGAVQRFITLVAKTASMVGVASFSRRITAARSFTTNLIGVADFSRRITAARSFTTNLVGVATVARFTARFRLHTVNLVGVASFSRRITAARSFEAVLVGVGSVIKLTRTARTATMVGVASFARQISAFRPFTTNMVGVASYSKVIGKVVQATMVGVAAFSRRITAARSFEAIMLGEAAMARLLSMNLTTSLVGVASAATRLIFGRHFQAAITSIVRMRVEMPQSALNRILGAGGTIIIRKIKVLLFDD